MANSKIIIIEGAQGAGKTTITDYIRHAMSYTNLYRLSGTADNSKEGLKKATKMYKDLQEYMRTLENCSVNLLFDRTFFTEEVYCRLGYKDYSFSNVYEELLRELNNMDFEIYYITLYLEDEKTYEKRLDRKDKGAPEYAKYAAEKSVEQQREYLKISNEIEEKYPKIKVFRIENSKDLDITKNKIKEILSI